MPVRSPKVSKDWKKISRLCCKSVKSIYRQESDQYNIKIVCNEEPEGICRKDSLGIIKVDFSAPSDKEEMMSDKIKKSRVGIINCKKRKGDYVNILDPDDRISRNLVSKIENEKSSELKIMKKGYVWPHQKPFVFKWNRLNIVFHRYNGKNMPKNMKDEGDYLIEKNHAKKEELAKKRGISVSKINFRGYLYTTDIEDNHSGTSFMSYLHKKRFLSKLLSVRPLTKKIKREFGVWDY